MAMTLDRTSLRLFGIDLAAVPGYLREGWAEALRWPALPSSPACSMSRTNPLICTRRRTPLPRR